jgi:hypothetical protein
MLRAFFSSSTPPSRARRRLEACLGTALDQIPIEKRRTYEAVPANGRPCQRTYDAMAFAF